MFITETQILIYYALTVLVCVVFHGHYALFYEIGLSEAIRQIGYTYKDIEAMDIIMPVVDIHSRFLRPAKYDDLITVKTTLKEIPTGFKIVFYAEIFNEQDELLNTGEVSLFFVDAKTMKRCDMPLVLREKLNRYFAPKI